ncbi:MAG: pseudouridine synthase [Pseudomonadota bacterium]
MTKGSSRPSSAPRRSLSGPGTGERIAKAMARAGLCSRRAAERLIAAGRVAVDGAVLASPAVTVTGDSRVTVDGQPLPARGRTRLFRYHKPRGLIATTSDPEGRRTIFDRLPPEIGRVVAVGRLDFNSEGLVLLTNDGELKRRLELPATGWLRRYRARVFGRPDAAALAALAVGPTVEGLDYGPIAAAIDRVQGDNAWLTIALREGRNREVRRVLAHLGLTVNRLIRVAYGPFQLGGLPRGAVDEVPPKVIRDQLGGSFGRPGRG